MTARYRLCRIIYERTLVLRLRHASVVEAGLLRVISTKLTQVVQKVGLGTLLMLLSTPSVNIPPIDEGTSGIGPGGV